MCIKLIQCTCIIFINWIEKNKLVNKHYIAKHICSINISKYCIHICSHAILNCILIWLYAVQIGRIYYLYDYVHILEFLIRRNKYFLEFQLKEVLMVFKITFGTKTWSPSIILAKIWQSFLLSFYCKYYLDIEMLSLVGARIYCISLENKYTYTIFKTHI